LQEVDPDMGLRNGPDMISRNGSGRVSRNRGFMITVEAVLAMVIMFSFFYIVAGQYNSQTSTEVGVKFLEHYNNEILDLALNNRLFQQELDEDTPDYSAFEAHTGLMLPPGISYRFFVEKDSVKTCIMPAGCTSENIDRNSTVVTGSRYAYAVSFSDGLNPPKKREYKLSSEVWFDYEL